ncbi:MAG: universal stress protein [Nitrospirae bacterium]|nr:universal stress protein [Nitrospirota bacterium]
MGESMDNKPMCPIKTERILLVTDGTNYSDGAIREGVKFAALCSSRLYALSVIEEEIRLEAMSPKDFEDMEVEILSHLEEIKLKASKENVYCETILSHGNEIYQGIVEVANNKNINMIIIGRRGYTGVKKLLFGEVAAKIIGHASCKVLVVPRAARFECKNIIIGTDGSLHGKAAVQEGIEIAKRCGGSIIAICTCRTDDELEQAKVNVDEVVEIAQKENISVETLTPKGRSFDVIVDVANERASDLIVVGAYGTTGLKKLFMGNSTEKVIGMAPCAVLVVKAQ